MNKNEISQEILVDTAYADVAINCFGLTLDDPKFFSPDCLYVKHGINSEYRDVIRFETLEAMLWHLCTLKDGVALAKQLAKNSGFLKCESYVREIVIEDFIEEQIEYCRKYLSSYDVVGWGFYMAMYYKSLFRVFMSCELKNSDLRGLILDKVELYVKQQNINIMNYNKYIENNSLCSAVARLAIVECGMNAQYKTTKKGKYVVTDDWLDTLKLLLSLKDGEELALIYSRQSDGYTNDEDVKKTIKSWRKTFEKYNNFPFKNRIKFFIWVADVKTPGWLDNFINDYLDEHYTENLNPNYNFEQKTIL